jgi:hypothetical protein
VVAVGDVAAWWSCRYRSHIRNEHWDDAAVGPAVAVAALLTAGGADSALAIKPHDPVPYFWSDQFGHRLQYVGQHDPASTPIWREPGDGKGWSAAWLDTSGLLTAALTVDRPRDLLAARRAITAGATPDPVRLADPTVALTDA